MSFGMRQFRTAFGGVSTRLRRRQTRRRDPPRSARAAAPTPRPRERSFSPRAERSWRLISHDASDACFQVAACHARNIDDRRCNAQPARFQNAFRVRCRDAGRRARTCSSHARSRSSTSRAPIHQTSGMKPEHCADDHLHKTRAGCRGARCDTPRERRSLRCARHSVLP